MKSSTARFDYDPELSMPSRTEFWRRLSWQVGDDHADRICRLLDLYCRLFGIDPKRFHREPPR